MCGLELNPDREQEFMDTYRLSERDTVYFGQFYELMQSLKRDLENSFVSYEEKEYGKFVA